MCERGYIFCVRIPMKKLEGYLKVYFPFLSPPFQVLLRILFQSFLLQNQCASLHSRFCNREQKYKSLL